MSAESVIRQVRVAHPTLSHALDQLLYSCRCGCWSSGARAEIEVTLPLPHGATLLDISKIHPRCPTYVAAASQTQGTAAALRDRSKQGCTVRSTRIYRTYQIRRICKMSSIVRDKIRHAFITCIDYPVSG
jgi:hypothetical protein